MMKWALPLVAGIVMLFSGSNLSACDACGCCCETQTVVTCKPVTRIRLAVVEKEVCCTDRCGCPQVRCVKRLALQKTCEYRAVTKRVKVCKPAPVCCAPAPVCCEPAPVCCAPEPVCCDPCAAARPRLGARVRHCGCN
jgi:hypothetical protein